LRAADTSIFLRPLREIERFRSVTAAAIFDRAVDRLSMRYQPPAHDNLWAQVSGRNIGSSDQPAPNYSCWAFATILSANAQMLLILDQAGLPHIAIGAREGKFDVPTGRNSQVFWSWNSLNPPVIQDFASFPANAPRVLRSRLNAPIKAA
jgi:hypothetical protein